MRRPILLAAFVVAAAFTLSVPLAAAAARMSVVDADVVNEDGVELTRVQLQSIVRLQARVENVGDAAHNGSLAVVFDVRSDDGLYSYNRTVSTDVSVAPDKQTNVSHVWSPTHDGAHTLYVYVTGQYSTKFTLHFTVAESEVTRVGLLDRALDYLWVYVGFFSAVVLFFAVARVRRPR